MKVAPQQPHHMRRRRGLLQGKHSQQSLSTLPSTHGAGCSASGCAASSGGASARPQPVQKAVDTLRSFPHSGQDCVAGDVLADGSPISECGDTATIVCADSSARIHNRRIICSAVTAAIKSCRVPRALAALLFQHRTFPVVCSLYAWFCRDVVNPDLIRSIPKTGARNWKRQVLPFGLWCRNS